jgi:hypothetical protein
MITTPLYYPAVRAQSPHVATVPIKEGRAACTALPWIQPESRKYMLLQKAAAVDARSYMPFTGRTYNFIRVHSCPS